MYAVRLHHGSSGVSVCRLRRGGFKPRVSSESRRKRSLIVALRSGRNRGLTHNSQREISAASDAIGFIGFYEDGLNPVPAQHTGWLKECGWISRASDLLCGCVYSTLCCAAEAARDGGWCVRGRYDGCKSLPDSAKNQAFISCSGMKEGSITAATRLRGRWPREDGHLGHRELFSYSTCKLDPDRDVTCVCLQTS